MKRFRNWVVDRWWAFREWAHAHETQIVLTALVILVIFVYLAPDMIITVGPGHSGVLWKRFAGGTVTIAPDDHPYIARIGANRIGDPTVMTENIRNHESAWERRGYHLWPYSEGIHLIAPWDRMYIYNIRLQQISHTYDALTNDGLDVKTEITIRWKPIEDDLGKLHRDIGPEYVDTLVIPLIGAFAREEIARVTPDALYSPARLAIQEAIRARTKAALMSRFYPELHRESYLIVEDVLIRSVELPPPVKAAIQDKIVQKQIAESYVYRLQRERQEAERKAIEAQGIQRFQATINSTISEGYLKWKGIDATLELAKSNNAKIVVIGAGRDGMPVILGGLDGMQNGAGPTLGPPR